MPVPVFDSEVAPMKTSRHIYMKADTQERLEYLQGVLGLSASGVVARAVETLAREVKEVRE